MRTFCKFNCLSLKQFGTRTSLTCVGSTTERTLVHQVLPIANDGSDPPNAEVLPPSLRCLVESLVSSRGDDANVSLLDLYSAGVELKLIHQRMADDTAQPDQVLQ